MMSPTENRPDQSDQAAAPSSGSPPPSVSSQLEEATEEERQQAAAPMEVDKDESKQSPVSASEAEETRLQNGDDSSPQPEQEAMEEDGDEKDDSERPAQELSSESERKSPKVNGGDVEKFDGKIVYNPDGSAFIIEDGGDLSDDESLPIPKVEGSIVDRAGSGDESTADGDLPQIANAFYISKSTAYYNALYGQAYVKMLQEKKVPETPVVHSYRVFSCREDRRDEESSRPDASKNPLADLATVPVKPILMCFICKLSFGCTQTFGSHCVDSHSLDLNKEEKTLLHSKNSSAIVQNVGKEKAPIVSFLEPFLSGNDATAASNPSFAAALAAAAKNKLSPPISPGAINSLLSAAAAASLPKVPSLPPSSSSPSPPNTSTTSAINAAVAGLDRHLSSSPLSAPTPSATAAAAAAASLSNARRSPLESGRSSAVSPSTQNNSPSPVSLPPSSAYSPQVPTNANMLQGTTIGACPDHVNGRPTGVECSKCDLILNQSRLGGMGWNVSRNSCKTLKCPKCNWHYKYQETLEIHMKEKHPENETTCIYCITGQQHPRLARGETYTCGYKPYRCEVCNYSTTTKGNLSIHMQSDKHLNNMQDLQNGGLVPPSTTPGEAPKLPPSSTASRSLTTSQSPLPSPSKQKPNWRCDVCNYETNVARNLRIHMTSEKHTHNIMSMQQQNAKMMMGAGAAGAPPGFPRLPGAPPGGLDPKNLLGLFAASGMNPPASGASEQAAMADLAYSQALLAQIMSGGQFPGGPPPPFMPPTSTGSPDFAALFAGAAAAAAAAGNDDLAEPPPEPVDNNPKHIFACCVCREFGCDTLDELSQHLSQDRSRTRENEVSIVIAGNYLCQLCNYKTNLKANFQLHCKTDKHLQRLSHVNHIKEGGPANEWKLRFLTSMNPVELRCNACDFVTNSPHKIQVHFSNQQHQVSALLFSHLKKEEAKKTSDKLSYNCSLCQFSGAGKHLLMNHVRSMKHLQMEQMHQLKKRAEGNMGHTEIGDIFQVVDEDGGGANSNDEESKSRSGGGGVTCPLCQENFDSQDQVESHAMSVHSVNSEGLSRLQALISDSHWLNKQKQQQQQGGNTSSSSSSQQGNSEEQRKEGEGGDDVDDKKAAATPPTAAAPSLPSLRRSDANFNYSLEKYLDPNRPFKCDVCRESFTQKNILLVHYNSVSHLHKLKKSMQEQQGKPPQSNGGDDRQQATPPQEKTPTKKGSALEALVGNMKGDRAKEEEDEVKPFKCNICKVAYSQGSTLDIHIRSVLHQTKASKLQELILTNQIDLSKPLIEQPDPQQLQDQHKKMISDMLSPKSVNSTGSTNSQSSPNVRGSSSPNRAGSPQSSPLANLQQALLKPGSDPSSSPEDPQSSSSAAAAMGALGMPFPFGIPGLANMSSPPDKKDDDKAKGEPSPVLKNLLQSYGLEMVKQFSDLQKKQDEEKTPSKEDDEDKELSRPSSQVNSGTLTDVQEALQKAMIQAQLQQMNPMLMQMSQLQNLNPLIAMNLHPPLIPPALLKNAGAGPELPAAIIAQIQQQQKQQQNPSVTPPMGLMDPKLLALMAAGGKQDGGSGPPDLKNLPFPSPGSLDPKQTPPPPFSVASPMPPFPQNSPMPDPKALLMQQQPIPNPVAPPPDQGKRARTRITDDQLKVLRSNFDISNSPTEEALHRMAGQTGLPIKVIKHWFRNTLFKERQKNKDSPYNFSNPPSTKLNLEEYEKTGEPKVTPLNLEDQAEYVQESGKQHQQNVKKEGGSDAATSSQPLKSEPIKSEVTENKSGSGSPSAIAAAAAANERSSPNATATPATNTVPKLTESSSENSLTLSRLLSSQIGPLPVPGGLLPNFPAFPNVATPPSAAAAPLPPTSLSNMPDYLNTLANRMPNTEQSPRPSSPQSVSSGKRANRTRFTDYQIKVLQEFFENNAYPKDDDLEYLSKLLSLSPRVIVVWFQNARQKARKIYENQPPAGETNTPASGEEDTGRFTRTPGCNYQCKKCLLVFQRYYELIRHQKQHCYKEEDAKRSAQAQKAAAQAAAQFAGGAAAAAAAGQLPAASEDSNSSLGGNEQRSHTLSPATNITLPNAPDDRVMSDVEKRQELAEMSKDAVNRLFGSTGPFLPNPAFNLLQQQALQQQQLQAKQQQDGADSDELLDDDSLASSPSSKRKLSEDGGDLDEDGHRDKRLRTTIQPAQLEALYQKYQLESNPSRRQLEQIAAEVGLRKRVVQVWFQNTRARERKGQYIKPAAAAPPPPAQLKSKLTGESDESSADQGDRPAPPESPFTSAFNLQNSMRKYYEDTMKRFMNDIQDANNAAAAAAASVTKPPIPGPSSSSLPEPPNALDLTSDFDAASDHMEDSDANKSMESDANNATGGSGVGGSGGGGNKRFRTQMSGVQVKMMKGVFEVYKTPTMTECSSLGADIGLQKRVVQVWFQNARAKEKRAKLQLQQATGGQEPEAPPPPEECVVCPGFRYGHKFAVQDHIFTRAHLDNLRGAIEAGQYDPESPGHVLSQTAAVIQQNNGSGGEVKRSGSTEGNNGSSSSMQMLQMATTAQQVSAAGNGGSRELLDSMSSHQNNPRMLMQV